jgi:hypothetical protein
MSEQAPAAGAAAGLSGLQKLCLALAAVVTLAGAGLWGASVATRDTAADKPPTAPQSEPADGSGRTDGLSPQGFVEGWERSMQAHPHAPALRRVCEGPPHRLLRRVRQDRRLRGPAQGADHGPGDVTEEVKKSVLRGRGGAGFPTGLKWTFLPKAEGKTPDGRARYLAVNADESEPGTFKDRLLMDFDPHLLLEGIAICCTPAGSTPAYIYIRGEYHHQATCWRRPSGGLRATGSSASKGLINSSPTPARGSRRLLRAPRRGRVHLRRGDGAARIARGQARLAAHQAALPRREGALRPADHHQQRRDARHLPFIIENGAEGS